MSKHAVHIGKKIKEVVVQTRLKKTEFADLINISRTVVYDIFKRETIDTALLKKISTVLNHDFFSYYSAPAALVKESKTNYGYATKDEVAQLTHTVQLLVKEVEKLRQGLSEAPKTRSSKKLAKQKK
jgi:transcriptional regulator with XRE-family HTH domain